jgi:SAM-dependent methyltransferase
VFSAVYSDDLAYIHHRGFTRLAAKVAPELLTLLRRHHILVMPQKAPRVVEVGCGSGVLAAALVAAGYDVLGIDRSPAMIRIARATAPGARFRVQRLEHATLPSTNVVVAIGEIVTYVPGGLPALRRFFDRVRRALKPRGLFVFDFIESAERRTYRRKMLEGDDWRIVLSATTDRAGRILTRTMKLRRAVNGTVRTSGETHRVHIYPREEMAAALAAAGFRFTMRRTLGAHRLIAGDRIVIAS